jgi:hypothetical protein
MLQDGLSGQRSFGQARFLGKKTKTRFNVFWQSNGKHDGSCFAIQV